MAIDPKLVSIIPASQLPTGDPTNAADFLFYEGDALKKSPMSDIYDKITSGINLGFLTPSSPAAPAAGIHRGQATEAGTYTNFGSIVVTSAELLANFVYIEVTNGTAKKVLSAKPVADPAKHPLYSAIKNANIAAETEFIDDLNGYILYRVKTGQTLLTTELPANVVGIKVESIGISKLPKTYAADITGSCYTPAGGIVNGANYKRTGKIKIPSDVDVWAKVGASSGPVCLIYNEATIVRVFQHTNNEWQKIEINAEWTHIALSGSNEFDCLLEFRENDYIKNISEFIDSKGLVEHKVPFYRGVAVNNTTGAESFSVSLKSTNYIDVTDKIVVASGLFNGVASASCFCYDSNFVYLGNVYSLYAGMAVSDWTPIYLSGTKYVRFGSLAANAATVIVKGYWNELINSIPGIKSTNESQEKKVTTALSDVFYAYGDNWKKIADAKSYANYGIIWAGQSNAAPFAPFSSLATYGLPTTLPVKDFNTSNTYDSNMTIPNTTTAWGLYWSILSRLYNYKSSQEYRIIRAAVGATNLVENWNPLVALKQMNTLHQLTTKVTAAKALASLTNFKVMIWVQGEADSGAKIAADAYYQNLKNFIFFTRGLVGNPRLPFICVGVHPTSTGYSTYGGIVRKAMIDVCAEIHDCYFIDTAPLDATFVDGIHYDGAYNEKIAPIIFNIIKDF